MDLKKSPINNNSQQNQLLIQHQKLENQQSNAPSLFSTVTNNTDFSLGEAKNQNRQERRFNKRILVAQVNLTGSQLEVQNEGKNRQTISANSKDWTFEELSNYYQKSNSICRSWRLGSKYRFAEHEKLTSPEGLKYKGKYKGQKLHEVNCKRLSCDRCRRTILRKRLRKEIQRVMEEKKLFQHIVITTEGYDKYRRENNYIQSYKDMQITWNKIRWRLSYIAKKQGKKLSFVQIPRAQKNGYCHPHIVTNIKISQNRLQKIVDKYLNTGSACITTHKNTSKYLTDDFLKDHEYYIPIGQRHYTTSKDIKLNLYDVALDDTDSAEEEVFNSEFIHNIKMPENDLHIFLDPNKLLIDQLYDIINREYGYPPPFEILLAEFYKKVHKT